MKTYGRKPSSALPSAPAAPPAPAIRGFGTNRINGPLAAFDAPQVFDAAANKRQNKRPMIPEGEENDASVATDRTNPATSRASGPSKKKCPPSIEEILAAGHPEDLELLTSALSKTPVGISNSVRVWADHMDQTSDPTRCEQWLEKIGFQWDINSAGLFTLPASKATEVRKYLNTSSRKAIPDLFSKTAAPPASASTTAAPSLSRQRSFDSHRSGGLSIVVPVANSNVSPMADPFAASATPSERLTPDSAAAHASHLRAPTPSSNLAMDFGSMKLQSATPRGAGGFFRDAASLPLSTISAGVPAVAAEPPPPPPAVFVSGQPRVGSHDENDAELERILNEREVSGAAQLASRLEHERHGETTFLCIKPSPAYPEGSSIANAEAVGVDTIAPLPLAMRPPREVTRGRRSKSFNDKERPIPPALCQSPQRSMSQPTNFVTPTKDPGFCFNDTEGAMSDEIDRFRALLDYMPSSHRDENSLSQEPFPHLSENSNSRSLTDGFTVSTTAPSRGDSFISSQSSMFSDLSAMSSSQDSAFGGVHMDRDMLMNVEKNIEIVRSRSQGATNSGVGFGPGGFGRVNSALNAQRRLVRMHSSPISSFHNGSSRPGMHAIPEVDIADDLASPMDQRTPATDIFTINKDRLLRSKNRRMSGKLDGTVKKHLFSKSRRRQSNILFSRKTSPPAQFAPKQEEYLRDPDALFPILFGGVFLQRFEGIRPVVQRASRSARVISFSFGEGVLIPQSFRSALQEWSLGHPITATDVYIATGDPISLEFWNTSMGSSRVTIPLDGYSWYAIPACPSGILIMSTKFIAVGDKRRIGFYVDSIVLNEMLGFGMEAKMNPVPNQMETFDYATGNSEQLNLNISTSTDPFSDGLDVSALDISMNSEEQNRSDQNINLEDSGVSDKFTMHKSHHHLKSLVSRHFGDSPSMSPLVNHDHSVMSADDSKLFQSPIACSGMQPSTYDLTMEGNEYFRSVLQDPQLMMCNSAEPTLVIGSVLGLVMEFLGEEVAKPKGLRRAKSVKGPSGPASTNSSDCNDPRGFHAIRAVCKHWGVQAANYLAAKRMPKSSKAFKALIAGANLNTYYASWSEFLRGVTSCEHIGTGGAKSVYSVARIASLSSSGIEALATIDVDVVVDHAVKQELSVSTLASALVRMRICPNILETYSTFESPFCIPKKFAGCFAGAVIGKPKSSEVGHYQYISMELCRGGDVEANIRRQPKKVLSVENVRSYLFQMIFSLYSSREQLNLRHNDVKLLNFLLSDASSLLPQTSNSMSGGRSGSPRCNKISLKLAFGEHVFKLSLPMTPTCPSLVKLADFGTSQVGNIGAETSITPEHFTTLENTPPEFLLLGSKATSSGFAGDTFGLGLCYLHLLTGVAPYEELLQDVFCPPDLKAILRQLWTTNDKSNQYYVIREVLDSLVEGDADTDDDEPALGQKDSVADDSVMNVLYDTLYRFVVLVGLPRIDLFASIDPSTGSMTRNPVVQALHSALGERQQFGVDAGRNSIQIYNQHSSVWSIFVGSSEHMKRARDKLRELDSGAGALLHSMLNFDPSKRCTMHEAILSDVFNVYREGGFFRAGAPGFNIPQEGVEVVFDYYAKPKSFGGSCCLPNV